MSCFMLLGSYITSYVTCVSKDQACHDMYLSPDAFPPLIGTVDTPSLNDRMRASGDYDKVGLWK